VDILLGTPLRLARLVRRKRVDLGAVRDLVCDEADQLLGAGLLAQLDRVLAACTRADKARRGSSARVIQGGYCACVFASKQVQLRRAQRLHMCLTRSCEVRTGGAGLHWHCPVRSSRRPPLHTFCPRSARRHCRRPAPQSGRACLTQAGAGSCARAAGGAGARRGASARPVHCPGHGIGLRRLTPRPRAARWLPSSRRQGG